MNPLITVALITNGCQSWIAKFEVEFIIAISEVLKPIKDGVEVSIGIVWIFSQHISSIRKYPSCYVVVENFDVALK